MGKSAFLAYESEAQAKRFDANIASPHSLIVNILYSVLMVLAVCLVYEGLGALFSHLLRDEDGGPGKL